MGGLEIDFKAYEDPAPKNPVRDAAETNRDAQTEDAPVVNKRKLPFRANIQSEGRRYKGQRTSRADLELDTATIGLLGEGEDEDQAPDDSLLQESDRDDESQEDALLEDAGADSSIENDIANADLDDEFEESVRKRTKALEADERAAVEHLVKAEQADLRKARAVQKQRELYDAAVDMRIKLEPLMSLGRTFPNSTQRKESSAWKESEELSKALSSAEGALASLCAQAEELSKRSGLTYDSDEETGESAEDFTSWRNGILDEWGRKMGEAEGHIAKGGFKAIDTSISTQMKASLASGKHVARTRRVRESIDLLGGSELEKGSHDMQYDDGELYRTLLRDIIESGDAAGGGLRFAQLSKGGRIRKKRDTSFAKGKRLRYDVHEKLVGFLTPLPMPDPGPVDEIIANLFGRMGAVERIG